MWYGQQVNSQVTKSLFIPVWPEGQCGVFLCRCYWVTSAVWWEFGRRVLASQGREEATLWAAAQEVAEEVELGCVCYTSGSCCCRWVVKGDHGFHLRRDLLWHVTGAWLFREHKERGAWCFFPCCSVAVEIVVCESLGASHDAVAKRPTTVAESILLNCLSEKYGLPGGSCLLCLKSLWVGWRRVLLTATSANSLGKPKGTLRQPRSLSMPEEGSKRPVPRPPRGRGVACGVVKPTVESARSALPPAAGSGPSKEIPMQRHVTVVNRSVCAGVCVRAR